MHPLLIVSFIQFYSGTVKSITLVCRACPPNCLTTETSVAESCLYFHDANGNLDKFVLFLFNKRVGFTDGYE